MVQLVPLLLFGDRIAWSPHCTPRNDSIHAPSFLWRTTSKPRRKWLYPCSTCNATPLSENRLKYPIYKRKYLVDWSSRFERMRIHDIRGEKKSFSNIYRSKRLNLCFHVFRNTEDRWYLYTWVVRWYKRPCVMAT